MSGDYWLNLFTGGIHQSLSETEHLEEKLFIQATFHFIRSNILTKTIKSVMRMAGLLLTKFIGGSNDSVSIATFDQLA